MINIIQYFFLWCSGVDIELLDECNSKEKIKYAGLGVLVLIPAILGFISMSYALSTLINSSTVYMLGGGVWALIVFAIDRYIVSTFVKKQSINEDFFSFQFFGRLIFAVGIGILISHPTVLFVFNDTIEQELLIMRDEGEKDFFKKYEIGVDKYNSRNDTLSNQIKIKEQERKEWQQFLSFEISGKDTILPCCGKTTGLMYYGPATKKIEDRISVLGDEIKSLKLYINTEITNNNTQLKNIQTRRDSIVNKYRAKYSSDYIARGFALNRIENKDGGKSVTWTKWFLIVFIVFIDILPVFLKMATKRGEYDKRLDSEQLNIHIPYGYEKGKEEEVRKQYIDRMTILRISKINDIFNSWEVSIFDFTILKENLSKFINVNLKFGNNDSILKKVIDFLKNKSLKLFIYLIFGFIQAVIIFFIDNGNNLNYITIGTFGLFILNFLVSVLIDKLLKNIFNFSIT